MTTTLIALTVGLATTLGAGMAAPQAVKLSRSGDVAGLSLTWAAASLAVNLAWAVYGVSVNDVAIVPVSVLSMLCYLWIASLLIKHTVGPRRAHIARATSVAALLLGIAGAAAWWGGAEVAGITLGTLYGAQLLPAVVTVYRSADVGGVSVTTWGLALAEAGLWGLYGVHRIDLGIITLAVMGVLMSGLVLARVAVWQARARRQRRDANQPAYAMA